MHHIFNPPPRTTNKELSITLLRSVASWLRFAARGKQGRWMRCCWMARRMQWVAGWVTNPLAFYVLPFWAGSTIW